MADSTASKSTVSPGPSHPAGGQFHFISVQPGSAREQRKNNQLAHAHLAKIHRQKQHSSGGSRVQASPKRSTRSTAKPKLASHHSIDLGWYDPSTTEVFGAGKLLDREETIASTSQSATLERQDTETQEAFDTDILDSSPYETPADPPARTLSPVLGR